MNPIEVNFYSPPDIDSANEEWNANCGPCAIAALAGRSLADVRPHLGDFEKRGYMNPTQLVASLQSLGFETITHRNKSIKPEIGLIFVQWHGPWLKPGAHWGAAYRHTHTFAVLGHGAYDVNVGHWVDFKDWVDPINGVGAAIAKEVKRCDGTWSIRAVIEVPAPSYLRVMAEWKNKA